MKTERSYPRYQCWSRVFVCLVITGRYSASGLRMTSHGLFMKLDDARSGGQLLYEGVSPSTSHCSVMCLGHSGCDASNYISDVGTCQLLEYGELRRESGFTYIQRAKKPRPRDCQDVLDSGTTIDGIYIIALDRTRRISVYCQFDDGVAWMIFLKRINDSVPFETYSWAAYKTGFGHVYGAYFIGNDNLHDITVNRRVKYALRVDLTADTGTSLYADYMYFAVTREDYKYRLILGPYDDTSSLDDSFSGNNGQRFSTSDQDNDSNETGNCAQQYAGGWWYSNCTYCSLTSEYGPNSQNGIFWNSWPSVYNYFRYAAMKMRRILA
ncbi:hypothetical protein LSH36_748g02070 [Paralvinella palmiformis]|uniref:Fibrinogen C-terminal domain-containing protein n=1 Tax=Paralvinella palmiformis TaxID=53620 RepID=A0AAD9MVJ0_9ANNE|nr:hypothetical protein LSH36_748g02070 [Paralvinella palmiformis]